MVVEKLARDTGTGIGRIPLKGLAAVLASGAGNQTGAALGAHAFPLIGPAGVVAVRQAVAAIVLTAVARPPWRRWGWAQWWPTLLLGGVFAGMNLGLYLAVDRLGLGLAVTLEFLGPLAVALLGSRARVDVGWALLAGAGVVVLVSPGPSTDVLGIGLGLAAACCWATYILLNRLIGTRLPGLQGAAASSCVATVIYLPVLVGLVVSGALWGPALWLALAAGLLSSVVPYAADLTALRWVPARTFGVLMSLNPVLAALSGLVLLGQGLAVAQWAGIGMVVAANAGATLGVGQRAR